MMRTMLQERHRPLFSSLNHEQMDLVWQRVVQAWPADMRGFLGNPPDCPTKLFETCREAGLDHARVVLSLAREYDLVGRATIEALVGRPIVPWAATVEAARPAPPRPVKAQEDDEEGEGEESGGSHLDRMVVVSVNPVNPHREGTKAWREYNRWVVGKTVAELLQKGMSRRAARRGPRNGWVILEEPK